MNISVHSFKWRRPGSNRCPNIFFKSFLHAYSVLFFSGTNWKQTTDQFLSCMVLSDHHSLWSQHLVLFWVGGGAWKQANLPGGPNDYLITD